MVGVAIEVNEGDGGAITIRKLVDERPQAAGQFLDGRDGFGGVSAAGNTIDQPVSVVEGDDTATLAVMVDDRVAGRPVEPCLHIGDRGEVRSLDVFEDVLDDVLGRVSALDSPVHEAQQLGARLDPGLRAV